MRISKLIATAGHSGFHFDYGNNVIFYASKIIRLSPHEADLLRVLLDNRARPTPISALVQKVYGAIEPDAADVSIRVAIHSLRKKIQETGICIRTQPKVGYEIDVSHIAELNDRLDENILVAFNLARATDEFEVAVHLAAALALAEVKHQKRGNQTQNVTAQAAA